MSISSAMVKHPISLTIAVITALTTACAPGGPAALESTTNTGSSNGGTNGGGGSTYTPPSSGSYPNGTVVNVSAAAALKTAIANAKAGDVITLAPGTYAIGKSVWLSKSGTASRPIVIRAARLGDAKIVLDPSGSATEGFIVDAPYWIIENLDVTSTCTSANHSACEHAIHIKGHADNLVVRGNYLHEFNAMIKGGGDLSTTPTTFSDDVVIEDNRFQNSSGRVTSNPVTFVDINGGRRWVLRGNRFADAYKDGGNYTSYAAFFKSNSRDGLMENNLVVCKKKVAGGAQDHRRGLSFGGGGSTDPKFCEDSSCVPQHQGGVLRNNIIVNCTDDAAYMNMATDTKIYNNTLHAATGYDYALDLQFAETTADVRNNLMHKGIWYRSGTATTGTNVVQDLSTIFNFTSFGDLTLKNGTPLVNAGAILTDVQKDFCGQARVGQNDIGAVQYSAAGSAACLSRIRQLYDEL